MVAWLECSTRVGFFRRPPGLIRFGSVRAPGRELGVRSRTDPGSTLLDRQRADALSLGVARSFGTKPRLVRAGGSGITVGAARRPAAEHGLLPQGLASKAATTSSLRLRAGAAHARRRPPIGGARRFAFTRPVRRAKLGIFARRERRRRLFARSSRGKLGIARPMVARGRGRLQLYRFDVAPHAPRLGRGRPAPTNSLYPRPGSVGAARSPDRTGARSRALSPVTY